MKKTQMNICQASAPAWVPREHWTEYQATLGASALYPRQNQVNTGNAIEAYEPWKSHVNLKL